VCAPPARPTQTPPTKKTGGPPPPPAPAPPPRPTAKQSRGAKHRLASTDWIASSQQLLAMTNLKA
ncbi:hypothetical protein P3G22_17495, partial [Rhodopseudomonas sp. BAL398]|nr:hypothetical protein [Rhodopseudomonas sp. BAL398]